MLSQSSFLSQETLQKKLQEEVSRGTKLGVEELSFLQVGDTVYYKKQGEEKWLYGKITYIVYDTDGKVDKIIFPPYKKGGVIKPVELTLIEIEEIYKKNDGGTKIEMERLKKMIEQQSDKQKQMYLQLIDMMKKYNHVVEKLDEIQKKK